MYTRKGSLGNEGGGMYIEMHIEEDKIEEERQTNVS
jgi:hypothetical protein